jgi:hypothetical protein
MNRTNAIFFLQLRKECGQFAGTEGASAGGEGEEEQQMTAGGAGSSSALDNR